VIDGLSARLDSLAIRGETATYGALVRDLGLTGPGSISRLTAALEATMAEDAALGQPLRAVLCEGRLAGGLPSRGFFEAAERLGRFDPAQDPVAFVAAERARLSNAASRG
jgi:hypothetical protein